MNECTDKLVEDIRNIMLYHYASMERSEFVMEYEILFFNDGYSRNRHFCGARFVLRNKRKPYDVICVTPDYVGYFLAVGEVRRKNFHEQVYRLERKLKENDTIDLAVDFKKSDLCTVDSILTSRELEKYLAAADSSVDLCELGRYMDERICEGRARDPFREAFIIDKGIIPLVREISNRKKKFNY